MTVEERVAEFQAAMIQLQIHLADALTPALQRMAYTMHVAFLSLQPWWKRELHILFGHWDSKP